MSDEYVQALYRTLKYLRPNSVLVRFEAERLKRKRYMSKNAFKRLEGPLGKEAARALAKKADEMGLVNHQEID